MNLPLFALLQNSRTKPANCGYIGIQNHENNDAVCFK
jgi:hypothetical protein